MSSIAQPPEDPEVAMLVHWIDETVTKGCPLCGGELLVEMPAGEQDMIKRSDIVVVCLARHFRATAPEPS